MIVFFPFRIPPFPFPFRYNFINAFGFPPGVRDFRNISSLHFINHLAHGDVEANGAWVVVLEVVEGQAARGSDLVADALPAGARTAGDDILIASRDAGWSTEILVNLRDSAVAGLLGSWAAQQRNVKPTGTAETESRGSELVLGREEEDERASLARIRGWNVKVEDG